MKKIILLGASGSIGTQTLDVISKNPSLFSLVGASVGKNTDLIENLINDFKCYRIYCIDQTKAEEFQNKYPFCQFFFGENGLIKLIDACECDWLVSSLIGFVGFKPTVYAIEKGINIALANKEILVAGGEFVSKLAKQHQVKLTPIDSEHSALYQCLSNHDNKEIKQVIITASGGSFRDKTVDELAFVTKQEALKHPNWSMGQKITIDSATMMNKVFEVVEAHWLFDLSYDQINVLISKKSDVHGMIEFQDRSILAQLATSDMRLPILYALSDDTHLSLEIESLDLSQGLNIDLIPVNKNRYRVFEKGLKIMRQGGNFPTLLNAINEVFVDAFLNDKITFLQLENLLLQTMDLFEFKELNSIEDVLHYDDIGRQIAKKVLKEEAWNLRP